MTRARAVLLAAALATVAAGCEEKEKTSGGPAKVQQPAQKPAEPAAKPTPSTSAPPDPAKVEQGKKLYTSLGCVACHSLDGSPRAGPTFAEVYGEPVTLTDGSTVTVDDAYIRESILEPTKKMVKGYVPSMPAFKGRISDEELDALVALIHSLK